MHTLSSQLATSLQIENRLPSLLIGADTQQKNELLLCCYYSGLDRVPSGLYVCGVAGWHSRRGLYWGAVLSIRQHAQC